MNIEALPKILFLHEENEEMQDRRIRVKVQYDTTAANPVKKYIKKINNTISLSEQISPSLEINALAYSNKLGLLITSIENHILITDSDYLETLIATSDTSVKSLSQVSSSIDFSGKVYLSPDETKFLAVNQDQFMLFDLKSQNQISRGSNEHKLRHIVFVTQNSFAGWNFHSGAYLYQDISESMQKPKSFEGVSTCTSVNVIENHLIVFEKINQSEDDEDNQVKVFDQTASNKINTITLAKFNNQGNYIFNFTQVISIFNIKRQKPQQFSQNDEYGLVLAYYDDFQEEPDRRYVSFLKGNLLKPSSKLQIRAFDLFLSPTEDRSFYYDQNQKKIPFQVQIISTKSIKVIMIEHHEIVFVVDCQLPFDQLNLYTLQPAHEIKLQDKKYFKGICLMKNMLDFERKPPVSDSNSTCDMICKDFSGEFMSLYFPSKETELTVPFPESLLILGDNKISRRYAVETYGSIEEDKTEEIKKRLSEIFVKQRVYRIENKKTISLSNSAVESRKTESVPSYKQPSKQNQKQKPKEEEKKPALFGSNSNMSSLFTQVQIGGPKQQVSAPGTSLFGAKTGSQGVPLFSSQPAGTSIFNTKPSTGGMGSIFDKKQPDSIPFEAGSKGGNLLFDKNNKQQKQLALKAPEQKDATEKQSLSGGLFSNISKQQKPVKSGNLFQIESKPVVQNFLSTKTQQSSLFNKLKEQNQSPPLFSQINTLEALFDNKKPENDLKQTPFNFTTNQTKKQIPITSQSNKSTSITENSSIPPNNSAPITKLQKPIQSKEKVSELEQNKMHPEIKPKQSKQKIVQKPESPKVQVRKEPIADKKPINLDKLKELGSFFGHQSTESIPTPLMNLTDEQIDVLISQMSLVLPKKDISLKSRLELARQKLLKQEHFTKIVQSIDKVKDYLKKIKQVNSVITSPTIFTLSNVQQLVKSNVQNRIYEQEELKSKNPLSNLVKNYAQRMEFLQKKYLNLDEQVENLNPNNPRAVQGYKKAKQQRTTDGLSRVEQQIQCLMVYQKRVFADRRKMFSFTENNQNLEQKLTDLVKSKTQECSRMCLKVSKLLSEVDEEPQRPIRSRMSSVRSNSILMSNSKLNNKKGHFAFSLESSQSDEQLRNTSQTIIQNHSFNHQPSQKPSQVLIKFKPKPIDMTIREVKNHTPLVKLYDFQVPLNQNPQTFNFNALFWTPTNPLQSSLRKSVNFKDKIPIKKTQQDKIKKIFKFGQSQDFESLSNKSQQDDDFVPNMGRNISKIHPQTLLQKTTQKSIPQSQTNNTMQFKKTSESDVPSNKASPQIIKTAVQQFGKPSKKAQQKQQKNQKSKISDSGSSLFSGVTKSLLHGAKNLQESTDKIEDSKSNSPNQNKKSLFGFNQSKKVQTELKGEKKKEEKAGTGFGNKEPQAFKNLFNSGVNFGQSEDKLKGKKVEKKEEKKGDQVKKQQKDKKQATSLFGNILTPSPLNKFASNTSSSLFANPLNEFQQTKAVQASKKQPGQEPKAAQKLQNQYKKTDEAKTKEQSKQEQKTGFNLFGQQNKSNLFGNNNTSNLFSKKQQTKTQTSAESKSNIQQPLKAPAFGLGGSTSLFGSGGMSISQTIPQNQPDQKPKTQTYQVSKPSEQSKPQGTLFGSNATNEQKDNQEKKKPSLNFNLNKEPTLQPKSQIAPTSKPSNQNPPVTTQQNTSSLFGNNTASANILSQPASNPSGLGGLFNQSKPLQTFGATNRFMAQQSQAVQPQSTPSFNPNAFTFGGGENGFSQSATSGMKSFSSFGGNQTGGMFGQSSNNQPQGSQPFGSSDMFGNSNGGQPSSQSMFGSLQSGQGGFGNQGTSLFGGMNQQQPSQGSGNFLSGFNPNLPSMSMQTNAGSTPNASMFKARK